ncbi:S-layer homology domain-containing protein [Athalassotoga saccharophila]|uniref:S-layer homology domain-containing protein n=1 Tax=Athalassotoga saccharophila TaxID=1441386 RepID=UPI00137B1996|nr:S-layer homology domain-containing protein [Athalassotoga saccharophila]BBJ27637.1 S-layer domain-containing protein [Athalassotoga saccharophila]
MKRFLIFSLVLLLPVIMMGSMVINDVSPSSDLYPYVVEMVQDNIMSLDSNNDFNGSLVVTRADLARILSNLLNYLQGRIQPASQISQPTVQGTSVSPELLMKIQQIENTVNKYPNIQAYITNQASTLSVLSSEVNQIYSQVAVMQNILSSLSSVQNVPSAGVLSKVIDRVSNVENNLKALSANYASLSATVVNIQQEIEAMNVSSSLNSQIKNLQSENETLKSKVSSLESTLGSIYFFQAVEIIAVIGALAYILFVK